MSAARGEACALITGGAGFVGSNLAQHLLEAGRRVLVFDNLSRRGVERNLRSLQERYPGRLEVEVADIRDTAAVSRAVHQATEIYHFAAQVAVTTSLQAPVDDFEINARGTLNVLEAARRRRPAPVLIFTSTNKVYGALDDVSLEKSGQRYQPVNYAIRARGIDERRPLDFHSPYGCSKGAADQYVLDYARSYELPAIVFRMSCIYGPHQFGNEDQGWVAHFLIRALDGAPVTVFGDGCQVRDVLYVEDLVEAFCVARANVTQLAGQAYNIGGGPQNTLSLLELLALLKERYAPSDQASFAPWRIGDQRYYVTDISRFSAATGWRPRTAPREGVAKLADWLERTVPLPRGRGLPLAVSE
jgi:CDP-paratose 2-epimerase